MLRFCSILVLALLGFGSAALATTAHGVRVVDGDSLIWHGQKVRLFGIDAPERDQSCDRAGQVWACGAWSTTMLARAIGAGPVDCTRQDTDRYGRMVAVCTSGGRDIAQAQVLAGAAQAYRAYSRRYLPEEAAARSSRVGIWAGHMVTPQVHRQPAPPAAPQATPVDCVIKGNISANGRIYHRPGQNDYDATRITPSKGEAWFCTASEAEAAGFRPARR